jgi:hypothetical protein
MPKKANRERILWLLITAVLMLESGCTVRYAQLHISARPPASLDIYNGANGLHLGATPVTILLKQGVQSTRKPVSLLVRTGPDGCPAYWQIVQIEHWSKTIKESEDATQANEVLFTLRVTDCPH